MTTPRRLRALGLVVAPLLVVAAPSVAAASADATSGEACTELVTHAPTGSNGDTTAVAITSQVLVADVEGWEAVSWEASDGVELDAVLVDTAEGTEVLEGAPTGDAHGAQQLTFCGDAGDAEPTAGGGSAEGGLAAGPFLDAEVPLVGASVGGLLAALVLLGSLAGRRTGRDHRTIA